VQSRGEATGRIPSLDGLRAAAIALVVLTHAAGTRDIPIHSNYLDVGDFGVRIFFVISGYLITTLLIAEHTRTGWISLPRFYLRRTFRIFPAFYVYLAALAAGWALGWLELHRGDLVHAATYTSNYQHDRSWEVGHLWSLAVEEQFYLLWPALLVAVGRPRAPWIAAAVIVLGPVVRIACWHLLPTGRAGIGESFHTVADVIAVGCLLAFVRPTLHAWPAYLRLQRSPLFLVAPAIAIAANYTRSHMTISYLAGETAMNLGIALCVDWAITHPDGVVGAILNARPVVYLGTLSYSLYLWQQPFLDRYSTAWVCAFPQNLGLAGVTALASYYLVERPLLRRRPAHIPTSPPARTRTRAVRRAAR